ncbi:MAG: SDR family NAD(P)-dependent oxidoreductase [Opitutales bacterium]
MEQERPILVTGAAGFIGARTCELLLEAGWRVHGLDNLNGYYDPRLKQLRLEDLQGRPGFTFQTLDIEDAEAVDTVFATQPYAAVVNLAARAGVRASIEDPHAYVGTNVTGCLNLLESMQRHGVTKMVLASTSSLYAGQPMPFREDQPVDQPISPYAATKKAAEALAYSYHHLYGLDVTVTRFFTVFGPRGRPDMAVFRFIRGIDAGEPIEVYGDGTQLRDFTYIDDIAAGVVAALKPVGYEVVNLGRGDRSLSVNDLIHCLEEALGKPAQVRYLPTHEADMPATLADARKAKVLLGWEPRWDPVDGFRESAHWYLANKDRLVRNSNTATSVAQVTSPTE